MGPSPTQVPDAASSIPQVPDLSLARLVGLRVSGGA
jgi:hypothetical protein